MADYKQLKLFNWPIDKDAKQRIGRYNQDGFASPKHRLLFAGAQWEKHFLQWASEYEESRKLRLFNPDESK